MLEIYLQHKRACIYSVNVWETLRKEYRIVGSFLGSSLRTPALPIELLPEETVVLVNKGVCKLTSRLLMGDIPNSCVEKEYNNFQTNLLQAEQSLYKESRKDELATMIDKIIEGKKKKGVVVNQSREEFLKNELDKSCNITDTTLIWPIFTLPQYQTETVDASLTEILEETTATKCAVYKDLWEKGYYITSGVKFGGDFLIYLGDPVVYHAVSIVRCVENPNEKQHTTEIIAFGRLGSSVKKRALLASLDPDGSVSYITLNWLYT